MAARWGGRVAATKSCVIPEYEIPTMPTRPCATHGCVAARLGEAHGGLDRVRVRGVVAGVLDDRRVGAVLDRAGKPDVHGELRAVTGSEVLIPVLEMLRAVERLRRVLVG